MMGRHDFGLMSRWCHSGQENVALDGASRRGNNSSRGGVLALACLIGLSSSSGNDCETPPLSPQPLSSRPPSPVGLIGKLQDNAPQ